MIDKYNNDIAYVITSYQPNKDASDLLRNAIESILKNRTSDISLWIVDIGSPDHIDIVKPSEYPDVIFIYKKKEIRSYGFKLGIKSRLKEIFKLQLIPKRKGSYANGYMLDYIVNHFKKINYKPKYFITSHQDIFVVSKDLFSNLKKFLTNDTFAAGVLKQKNLSKEFEILHAVCCMWKYEYVINSKFGFKPRMPRYDAGERIVKEYLDKGLKIKNLQNSYNDFSVKDKINKKYIELGDGVDIAIDENSEVLFLHLGRGTIKSEGKYENNKKTNVQQWIHWISENK